MPSPEDSAPPSSWSPAISLTLPGSPACHPHITPGLTTDLAGVSSGQVQHVEEQAQLTAQAELLLAQVVLDQAADRLQEIQHLAETEQSEEVPGTAVAWAGLGHLPPGSCSCSRRWGCGAPAPQTASCCNA